MMLYMYTFLLKLLNMSITASIVIILILLLRLLLKRMPKIISYSLWIIVLFRLLCPVSVETNFSLFGVMDVPVERSGNTTNIIEYVESDTLLENYSGEVNMNPSDITEPIEAPGDKVLIVGPLEMTISTATFVWFAGVIAMFVYAAVSYMKLKQKLITASLLKDNIYLADEIESPFVMGLVRPKIYIPSSMEEGEQSYIIMHEQHHIERFDHIFKAVGFVALCMHWFNPLVWIAFTMAGKDMEMSCDEAVIKKMGQDVLADYTTSLLNLATGKQIIAGMPLAFGEGDTKGRIHNLVNWKKPAFWIVILAVIVCVAIAFSLITNPAVTINDAEAINVAVADIKENQLPSNFDEGNAIVKCDYKDGLLTPEYSVKVVFEGEKNEYRIDAKTGEIKAYKYEKLTNKEYDEELLQAKTYEGSLEDIVNKVIVQQHLGSYLEGDIQCASHIELHRETNDVEGEDNIKELVIYAVALYQEYAASETGVESVSGGCTPIVLTFAVEDEQKYALKEYWMPRDGSLYASDMEKKFPSKVVNVALEEVYMGVNALQAQCDKQAMEIWENKYNK